MRTVRFDMVVYWWRGVAVGPRVRLIIAKSVGSAVEFSRGTSAAARGWVDRPKNSTVRSCGDHALPSSRHAPRLGWATLRCGLRGLSNWQVVIGESV